MATEQLADCGGVELWAEWDETAGVSSDPALRVFTVGLVGKRARLMVFAPDRETVLIDADSRFTGGAREEYSVRFPATFRLSRIGADRPPAVRNRLHPMLPLALVVMNG